MRNFSQSTLLPLTTKPKILSKLAEMYRESWVITSDEKASLRRERELQELLKTKEKTLTIERQKKQRGSVKPEKVRKSTHQCDSALRRLSRGIGASEMVQWEKGTCPSWGPGSSLQNVSRERDNSYLKLSSAHKLWLWLWGPLEHQSLCYFMQWITIYCWTLTQSLEASLLWGCNKRKE